MTHKAKCDRCRYTEVLSSPIRSYEVSDKVTTTVETIFVWCAACHAIRWGEVLPNLSTLESELDSALLGDVELMESLKVRSDFYQDVTVSELLAEHVANLRDRVGWRRARKSPPRCLECGSIDVTPLVHSVSRSGKDRWTLKNHPGCGGVVTAARQPVLALDRRWLRYTSEGEMQQAYQMYPGRGAVPIDKKGNEP